MAIRPNPLALKSGDTTAAAFNDQLAQVRERIARLNEILDDIEAYLDRHSDVEGGGPEHPYRANEPKRLLDRLREARS